MEDTMKEQLISLKIAKIAKEKGFNIWQEKGFVRFIETGKIISEYWMDSMSDRVEFICFQPTQSLLQKWLREEHLKIISIVPLILKKLYYKVTVWEYYCTQETKSKFFETYEEALESGIEEALTLI